MIVAFALLGLAKAQVELTTQENDAAFQRVQSERFFAMADRIATLEAQMAQLGTANSPIAIGVNAISATMLTQTVSFAAQQATLSSQVSTSVSRSEQLLADTRTVTEEAARQASTAAQAQATTLRQEVDREISSLMTNVTTILATTGGSGDGSSPRNAGMRCRDIKRDFPSSPNGMYYVYNPVNFSSVHSTALLFGNQGQNGESVLRVFCNFATNWVTADAAGGLFRLTYADGMIEPFEVYTFNALYSFGIAGAAGGERNVRTPNGQKGGLGAVVRGAKTFSRGDRFYVYPGGKGGMQGYEDNDYYDDPWAVTGPKVLVGGWNGGGRGTRGGSGGGGASDIRTVKHDYSTKSVNTASLNSRIATAGGGGGCGHGQCDYRGGHGGGSGNAENAWNGAYGGQQGQGGRNNCNHWRSFGYFGFGGSIEVGASRNDGGGGGGGWYGGSAACTANRPGAGGSSNARGFVSAGRSFQAGQNAGHGYVEFKWQEI
jgi:hypothetical protein